MCTGAQSLGPVRMFASLCSTISAIALSASGWLIDGHDDGGPNGTECCH